MTNDKDITISVMRGDIDGEFLELERCICGKGFGIWEAVLGTTPEDAYECECGRRPYFCAYVKVYEVTEE